jgi:glycosyltransferase involved in cell wall biosynthesis
MSSKVSVIIPVYNKEKYIDQCLKSVIDQTYSNLEIIIIDDASEDNSLQIVKNIKDNRIKIIELKQNVGAGIARNKGIEISTGDYICFLDADDYWEPTYLETQAKMIHDFPNAKMWGTAWGMMVGDEKHVGHGIHIAQGYRGMVNNHQYFAENMFLYWTDIVVIDKQIFNTIDMFDERISCGEDVDLWWRIILHFPIAYTNECLAYYRQDTENRITLSKPKLQTHFVNFIEKYEEYYDQCPLFKKYVQHEALGHLYKYFREDPKNKNIKRILSYIDFSLQPFSYRLRYTFPKFYEWLMKIKK